MNLDSLIHIKKALGSINPQQVREMSERRLRISLQAADQASYERMEAFFLQRLSSGRRQESATQLVRAPIPQYGPAVDLTVYDENVIPAPGGVLFGPNDTDLFVSSVLRKKPEIGVPLAKSFLPFRKPFLDRVIGKISRENAFFSITTALPDVIPNIIELPWAIAEFATDTAFITMNQVRMAFLIAAASDRAIGYREQKAEIGTVVGSAFGWRAIARELVGKVPFGGGLIAKAAVSYAGTKVLGHSLERYYRIGYMYSRQEREQLYFEAFRKGKDVAARILAGIRPDLAAKLNQRAELQPPTDATPSSRPSA
jgi:hypothetical protein